MCHGLVTVATESTHNLDYVVILSVSTHPNSWKLCLGRTETNSIRQLPADTHTKFSHKLTEVVFRIESSSEINIKSLKMIDTALI